MVANNRNITFEALAKALGLRTDALRIRYTALRNDPKNADKNLQNFNKSAVLSENELKAILNAYTSGHHAIAEKTAKAAKEMLDILENVPSESAKNEEEKAIEQARIDREVSEANAKRQREESELKAKRERQLREESEETAKRQEAERELKAKQERIEKALAEEKAKREIAEREASELKARIDREVSEAKKADALRIEQEEKAAYENALIDRTRNEVAALYEPIINDLKKENADMILIKEAIEKKENSWWANITEFVIVNIISNIFAAISIANSLGVYGVLVAGILIICFIGIIKILNKIYSDWGAWLGIFGVIVIEIVFGVFHIKLFNDLLKYTDDLPFGISYTSYAKALALLISGASIYAALMTKADSADRAEKERCDAIDNRQ